MFAVFTVVDIHPPSMRRFFSCTTVQDTELFYELNANFDVQFFLLAGDKINILACVSFAAV